VHPQEPGQDQAGDDDELADDASPLGADVVDQDAIDEPQGGAGEERYGDHQALLRGGEVEVLGDGHAERAEQNPDHEAEVEIEEGGEESRGVPCLQEGTVKHGNRPRMR
jgi:hypothetical protein